MFYLARSCSVIWAHSQVQLTTSYILFIIQSLYWSLKLRYCHWQDTNRARCKQGSLTILTVVHWGQHCLRKKAPLTWIQHKLPRGGRVKRLKHCKQNTASNDSCLLASSLAQTTATVVLVCCPIMVLILVANFHIIILVVSTFLIMTLCGMINFYDNSSRCDSKLDITCLPNALCIRISLNVCSFNKPSNSTHTSWSS